MNKVKIQIIGIAALLAIVTCGCKTTTAGGTAPPISVGTNGVISVFGNVLDPVATGNNVRNLAQTGAAAAIVYDENSVAYLQLAETTLTLAIQNGQYDPVVLASALANISVKEARDPKVTQGITAAINIYAIFAGQVVTAKVADVSPYLVPVLTGIRDGISNALALHAASNATFIISPAPPIPTVINNPASATNLIQVP